MAGTASVSSAEPATVLLWHDAPPGAVSQEDADRVEVRDLGSVEPRPTVDQAKRIDGGKIQFDILAGPNELTLEFKSSEAKP